VDSDPVQTLRNVRNVASQSAPENDNIAQDPESNGGLHAAMIQNSAHLSSQRHWRDGGCRGGLIGWIS
jgi:hypothetical protein